MALYDPKRMQVRVDVPLADAAKISVGQDAQITVEVLPDKPFVGTVTRVLHEANIQKNTLEVKVALVDPDPRLRPEMLARVKFLAKADANLDKGRHRLLVPEGAVRGTGANTTAWALRDFDGGRAVAVSKSVKVGSAKMDGWIEIAEGLQPGDLVVTGSASELKDGKKVTVISPLMEQVYKIGRKTSDASLSWAFGAVIPAKAGIRTVLVGQASSLSKT